MQRCLHTGDPFSTTRPLSLSTHHVGGWRTGGWGAAGGPEAPSPSIRVSVQVPRIKGMLEMEEKDSGTGLAEVAQLGLTSSGAFLDVKQSLRLVSWLC